LGKRKDDNGSYWQNMRAYEKGLLEWALSETGDSPSRAAEMLGINASYLYERCKIVGIHRPGKGKTIDPETGDVVVATPKLKLVPQATPEVEHMDEVSDEPENVLAAEDDDIEAEDADVEPVDTESSEDTDEDSDDEDEYDEEEVPDDECICGAKLVTDDERDSWVECTTCHTNRLTNAAGAKPAVMLDDDEEESA
jgi:hypothetical protein